MIKQTILVSSPFRIQTKDQQLIFTHLETGEQRQRPIEDLGYLVLENPRIQISQQSVSQLSSHNVSIVHCDHTHMPCALVIPLHNNYVQNLRVRQQLSSSKPLQKKLWKQTVRQKIANQARLLESLDKPAKALRFMLDRIKSGDPDNFEAQASRIYWAKLFDDYFPKFTRQRMGEPPNNLLNYGYAILRAATARAIVGTGLLPTIGIHHKNKYNPFCLVDDIMEPYRPYIDQLVVNLVTAQQADLELNTKQKQYLLQVLQLDTQIKGATSPLMIALKHTAYSLHQCFAHEADTILYPKL